MTMYPGDWTEGLARLFGDREAIVDVDDNGAVRRRITHRDLAARVNATAHALVELGVKPGARVAILAKNRVEHLELMFACARLGALFLPMNWRLAAPEVAYIIGDAAPTVVVVEPAFSGMVPTSLAAPPGSESSAATPVRVLPVGEFAAMVTSCAKLPTLPQARVQIEDPWIILYTSGTTGNPKGALLPYRQVVFNAFNTGVALDLTSSDRTVTYTPLFHTGGLHVLTTPLLARGGCIVLCDGFDGARVLELTVSERCTLLFGVPTTFERMAETTTFATADLSCVRLALCGGAPCPKSLIARYTDRGIVFKQGYGLTEVGPNVLNLNAEDVVRKAGSAGRPNLTISAVVIDDDGRPVHGAGRGELCLGGPCVCLGYWNKPDATRASFTDDGLFRTGDVVEIDDEGFMTIVDRKKDMYISGGENVYPAEVEKVLSDHPGVRAAAVVGIPSAQWGEVGRAYLEARDGVKLTSDDVLGWARDRLARYKVPKEFVVVDALPRNPSGKVQKHLLSRA